VEGVTDRGTEGHLRCVCGNGLAGFEYLPMNETISAIRKRFEMGGGGGCVRNMCQVKLAAPRVRSSISLAPPPPSFLIVSHLNCILDCSYPVGQTQRERIVGVRKHAERWRGKGLPIYKLKERRGA
jgi:hypothetical protein